MAIIDGLKKEMLKGQKIADSKYDPDRDELTITMENGLRLVVDTKTTVGGDGLTYNILQIRTVVGG
jgi:hypothetical protein